MNCAMKQIIFFRLQNDSKLLLHNISYFSKSHILSNSLNQNQIKSNSSTKRRVIYQNKSSVNFNLVSGVSKDKLVKLSRNLSKIMVKPQEKNSGKPKVNNN